MELRNFFRHFKPIPTIIVLAVALPILVIGFIELHKAQSLIANFNTALGTVTGTTYLRNVVAENNTSSPWLVYPVVRFTTPQGQEVSFTDRTGSYPAEYKVGDRVKVLYNPDRPQEATIKNWMQVWFTPLLITALGFLPILALMGWVSWHFIHTERSTEVSHKPRRR